MNELIPVEYQRQRILTTEQLAHIYETDLTNITTNYYRNQDKFIEGKHYYLLKGEDLRAFKSHLTNCNMANPIHKFASQLYLWTKRGASRHCKMLGTDKAWEQFDILEESYFNSKKNLSLNGWHKQSAGMNISVPLRRNPTNCLMNGWELIFNVG